MTNQTISFSFFFAHVKQIHRQHWFFLAALGVLSVVNYLRGAGFLNLRGLFLVTAGLICWFSLEYNRLEKSSAPLEERTRWLKRTATWQVFWDLLIITASIHYSGGPTSPVLLTYLIYIGAISIFFSPRQLTFLTLVAILLYSGLMGSYALGVNSPAVSLVWPDLNFTGPVIIRLMIFYVGAMIFNFLLIASHAHKIQQDWLAADLQNAYLDRLHGLTKFGLGRMELAELVQSLSEEIRPVLGADSIYLTRWEHESAQAAKPEKDRAGLTLASSKYEMTLMKSVWWAGKALIAEDVSCSPYLSYKNAQDYPAKSVLAIPLYGLPGRRFLGALLVGYQTRHNFSTAEVIRAQQVADVAALLISRTRLYDETQRRASLLEQMAEQISYLTSDLKQTTLLPAIVESARNLLNAERAALHMYEKSSQKMRCEFSVGLSEKYLEHMATHFDESPEGQVLLNQSYVLIPDVQRDSRTSPIQGLLAQEKFMAYAVFALASPDGSLGALSLYWDQPRAISSDEVAVGCLFAKRAGALVHNVRLYEKISAESLTDTLTGLPNRRYIDQRLAEESQRSDRYGHPYALLMLDLDGFKAINDCFGHPIGDSVLRQTAEALQRVLRATDVLTRYGGDEFVVILPETSLEDTVRVAEKLKTALASTRLHLPHETQRFITSCMGVAMYPLDASTSEDLIQVADNRMYQAKRQGSGNFVSES